MVFKFEEFNEKSYSYVNKSGLDIVGNWTADYHYHIKAGRKPYTKSGFTLTEVVVSKKKSLPTKGVVFLKPEAAEKLNELGSQIEKRHKLYNELFDSYIYELHKKGYDEDENLKDRDSSVSDKGVKVSGFK
jgi:hypothetical protein